MTKRTAITVSALLGSFVVLLFAFLMFRCSNTIYTKEHSKQITTLANAKRLSGALVQYAVDNGGRLPPDLRTPKSGMAALANYLSPSSFESYNPNGGALLFNGRASGASIAKFARPEQVIAVYESRAWPDGRRAVGYLDGHVKLVSDFDDKLLALPAGQD